MRLSVGTRERTADPGIVMDGTRMFFRCRTCRWISQKDEALSRCPRCEAKPPATAWPEGVAGRLNAAVEEYAERRETELTLVLACDLLEVLLEMFFRDIFLKQGRPSSWVQLTLRKNKSLDLRLRYLFKESVGVSFPRTIHGTPFEGFDHRWAALRSQRVSLTTDLSPDGAEQIDQEARDLSLRGLALFAWLNNRYCV